LKTNEGFTLNQSISSTWMKNQHHNSQMTPTQIAIPFFAVPTNRSPEIRKYQHSCSIFTGHYHYLI